MFHTTSLLTWWNVPCSHFSSSSVQAVEYSMLQVCYLGGIFHAFIQALVLYRPWNIPRSALRNKSGQGVEHSLLPFTHLIFNPWIQLWVFGTYFSIHGFNYRFLDPKWEKKIFSI